MSFGKDNYISLCFFDALHDEAKGVSEETTGETKQKTEGLAIAMVYVSVEPSEAFASVV